MNARRFRNDSARRFAEFRWWGCALLAMFALVQTARGSVGPTLLDPFGSARPVDATRIAPAALNDANAGNLRIQAR